MNYFRTLISGGKKRFIDRKYNLDLSYITPRIIVMSDPTSFPKSLFLNSINDVSHFLNERHGNNYLLINLSSNDYDASKFNGRVIKCKIKYHMPPSLLTLFELCNIIDDYLNEDISNVIIINCSGGKGRVGAIVSCYLLYIKKFDEIKDAFDYYSFKRLYKGEGIDQPCQKRYVKYFNKILKSEKSFYPFRVQILSVELINMYEAYNKGYYVIEIMDNINMEMVEIHFSPKNYVINDEDKSVTLKAINLINQEQYGDVIMKISYNEAVFRKKLGKIFFNTAFLNSDQTELIFKAENIDPDIILKNKIVPKNYLIKINIKILCSQCPFKKKQNYCKKCKNFIEENKILFGKWEKIMENQKKYKDKKIKYNKNILFGIIDSDDCEYILSKEKEKNKSEKNLTKGENKNEKIEDSDKNFYEDNNDSNSLEESEGDDYEDKYDNNTETKQKDKLNDSFESECFIF